MRRNPKFRPGDLLIPKDQNINNKFDILALVVDIIKSNNKQYESRYKLFWIAHYDDCFKHKKTYLFCDFVDEYVIKVD